MIDDIRVRKSSEPDGPERSAPPVPKQLLTEIKSAPSTEAVIPLGTVAIQPESKDIDPPAVDEPEADEPESAPEVAPTVAARPRTGKNPLAKYWRHKLWTIPLTMLVIIAGLAALPTTRYMALAYFVSKPFTVTVTDSSTGTPISGATVKLDGQSKLTDSAGKASVTVPVGNQSLSVTKTYYKNASQTVFVDLSPSANLLKLTLVATGRQVPIKVINKITGKPIPEAEFTIGATSARSDLKGMATVVLPADSPTQDATVKADGYNDLSAAVQVTSKVVTANTFAMVPAGRLYFLSNLSGNLDVVSTNLDGSSRKTILAGTGTEDKNNTLLLAARDWKYLALLSKRDGGSYAKLYLINTSDNSLTTVDSSAANLTLVGWSGHYFAYTVQRPGVESWQPKAQSIMSYNADTKKSITLVDSKAMGTNSLDAQYQDIVYTVFLGSNLVYTTTWYKYPSDVVVSGQTNTMVSVKPDGTGSKTLKSVDAGTSYIDSVNLAAPDKLYFAVYAASTNYYRLDTNGNITQSSTITSDTVNQTYPTYLLSPSGTSTFWTSVRDGKNTLFVGDYSGLNGNQIASLSDYAPYGWFTDSYLLVQKNKSELYILPVGGGTPLKISDYFKPDYAFYGYGGGYGGL